jgi:hypothetical protein
MREKKKEDEYQGKIRQLPLLLQQARTLRPDQLDSTEKELDALMQWVRQKFLANEITHEEFDEVGAKAADITAVIQNRRASANAIAEGAQQLSEVPPIRPFERQEQGFAVEAIREHGCV